MIVEVVVAEPLRCQNGHEVTGMTARLNELVKWEPCGCHYQPTDVQKQIFEHAARTRSYPASGIVTRFLDRLGV